MTQPAVSQHLAGLEASLGERLFQRTSKRMLLTEHGQRLYARVTDAVEALETVSNPRDSVASIRLGAPHEFFEARVLPALSRAPELDVRVTLGTAEALVDALRSGALDAVVATVKRPSPELSYRGLFEEKFWLVGPPRTLASSKRGLERLALEQRWIAYAPDLPIIRRFMRQVLGRRLGITAALTVPDLRSVRRAVELGMGVSVLPDYLCEQALSEGRLSLVYLPEEPVTNDLWWATERHSARSPKLSALFALLRETKP